MRTVYCAMRMRTAQPGARRSAATYAHRAGIGCLLNTPLRQHIFEIFGANGVWSRCGNQSDGVIYAKVCIVGACVYLRNMQDISKRVCFKLQRE